MSWEIFSLVGALFIIALLIIFRNSTFVKQNWKYFLILIPFVVLVVLRILSNMKGSGTGGSTSSSSGKQGEDLGKEIEKLKDRLEEVKMETAIEVSAAKTKNEEVIKKLEEVKNIEDKSERRKKLAAMMG